jgi:RNA polymerase sigma-70 factor (ECF subfamily)
MDEAAFRAFYARTSRALWGYLARATGDASLADDFVQEAFFRFLRADFQPESEEHAKNYLFRIATNLLRDHFRSPKRTELALNHDPSFEGPGQRLELRHDLRKALMALKPRERQLLWLGHVERFSHREIGGILGLKPASIRLLLFRARRKLAGLLEQAGVGPEVVS